MPVYEVFQNIVCDKIFAYVCKFISCVNPDQNNKLSLVTFERPFRIPSDSPNMLQLEFSFKNHYSNFDFWNFKYS